MRDSAPWQNQRFPQPDPPLRFSVPASHVSLLRFFRFLFHDVLLLMQVMQDKLRTAKQALSSVRLLPEIPLEQPRKSLAVTGFVAGHLVNRIMDGVQVQGLGALGQIGLLHRKSNLSKVVKCLISHIF